MDFDSTGRTARSESKAAGVNLANAAYSYLLTNTMPSHQDC